jgi:hypothetical protein
MDPYREGRKEAKRQAAALKTRLGRNIELNEFELVRIVGEGGWRGKAQARAPPCSSAVQSSQRRQRSAVQGMQAQHVSL